MCSKTIFLVSGMQKSEAEKGARAWIPLQELPPMMRSPPRPCLLKAPTPTKQNKNEKHEHVCTEKSTAMHITSKLLKAKDKSKSSKKQEKNKHDDRERKIQ